VRRSLLATLGGVVALLLGLLLATPASASTPTAPASASTPTAGPDDANPVPERHCVLNVDSGKLSCVSDRAEINTARKAAASASPQAVVVNARLWSGFLNQGSSLEIQSGANCTADKTRNEFQIALSGGWNDVTSSFQVFGACLLRLYDLGGCPSSSATYPGAVTWAGTTNYVGDAFNDKASCVYVS
jgi:hypothetical protein